MPVFLSPPYEAQRHFTFCLRLFVKQLLHQENEALALSINSFFPLSSWNGLSGAERGLSLSNEPKSPLQKSTNKRTTEVMRQRGQRRRNAAHQPSASRVQQNDEHKPILLCPIIVQFVGLVDCITGIILQLMKATPEMPKCTSTSPLEIQKCLFGSYCQSLFAALPPPPSLPPSIPLSCVSVGFDRRETRKGKHFQMIQLIEECWRERGRE